VKKPTKFPPTHPGEILLHDYMEPLGLRQNVLRQIKEDKGCVSRERCLPIGSPRFDSLVEESPPGAASPSSKFLRLILVSPPFSGF
jgi:hypothetical protein